MVVVAAVGWLVVVFVAERTTAYVRRSRIEKRRSKAEYPLTDHNDPIGRTVIF